MSTSDAVILLLLFPIALVIFVLRIGNLVDNFDKLNNKKTQSPPATPQPEPETPIPEVGVIAYWGEHSAYLYHTQAIPNTAHAIQPYYQLRVHQAAFYRVQFEILNAAQMLVFNHKVEIVLLQATNLILPPARLPLSDLPRDDGAWTLSVHVNDVLATTYRFSWRNDDIDSLEGNIDSDGEIDESILPLLADNYAQPMSLNDLLARVDDQPKHES